VRLTQCAGSILHNSRAFPGTISFLSTGIGELKHIHLEGNVLDNAKMPMEER